MTTPQQAEETLSATAQQTIDLSQRVFGGPHVFVGVIFKNSGGSVVTPSAGTYTIDVLPVGMANFQTVDSGTDIDATVAPDQLSFAANAQTLRYTPTGITGADDITINISSNVS